MPRTEIQSVSGQHTLAVDTDLTADAVQLFTREGVGGRRAGLILDKAGQRKLIEALGGGLPEDRIPDDAIVIAREALPTVEERHGHLFTTYGFEDEGPYVDDVPADFHRNVALRHLALARFIEARNTVKDERAAELEALAEKLYESMAATDRSDSVIVRWPDVSNETRARWQGVARKAFAELLPGADLDA